MENSGRRAKALREVLTEIVKIVKIVKIVNENSTRTIQPIAAPSPARIEQTPVPERLLYPLPGGPAAARGHQPLNALRPHRPGRA